MEYTRGPHVANQKESGVCCDSKRAFLSIHEEVVRPYAKVVEDLRQAARLARYQECIDLLNSVDYFVILSDVFAEKLGFTFEEVFADARGDYPAFREKALILLRGG